MKVLRSFLKERLPKIRLIEPEGTYFAWLDCSGLGLSDAALENLIAHQAKLWLDGGSVFDKKSGQFERIVLACTKKTLLQALTQLEAACREKNAERKNNCRERCAKQLAGSKIKYSSKKKD